MLWVLVAVRVLVNPLSNVFQKLLTAGGVPPVIVVGVTHGLLTLVCLPLLLVESPPATRWFWGSMLICSLLAVTGNVLIVKALEVSDLSLLGPINSFKPVVSMIPGVILLGEFPSRTVLAGVALIVVGSYALAGSAPGRLARSGCWRLFSDRGVQYRLAALVLSATEAVFLKQSLLASAALPTFAVWSVLGFALLLPWQVALVAFRVDKTAVETEKLPTRSQVTNYLLLALTTGLMQLCTIIILGGFQVAAALALFQISTLVSVLLGWRVFREPDIARRLVGAAIMMSGAILIVTSR